MKKIYDHKSIETYVQNYWNKKKSFEVKEDIKKEKYYCLSMLPYPSGRLHMGHVRNYTISDVVARYHRLLGKNVLHPIGWDAFGLPAEEAAIQNKIIPAEWTYKNIKYMKTQLKSLGFSYDWSREIITCKPEFYKWEQWFFTKLYEKKMVYKKKSPVNWCPYHKTILANEQVINGACWRCDNKIIIKNVYQWFIKITNYAKQLLNDLKKLKDWPEEVKNMQKNWIGFSKGIEFTLQILNNNKTITVYTTRLDCLMGATFIAISPNHTFATYISQSNDKIKKFIKKYSKLSSFDLNKKEIQNQGQDTYQFAIHPISKKLLPIWIANFVIPNYEVKAVISVPAHNLNDWYFAIKQKIKIKHVILSTNNKKENALQSPMINKGTLFNSGKLLNGLNSIQASKIITNLLKNKHNLKNKIYYKMKDWSISRQRYWGTPIPIAQSQKGSLIPVPEDKLPIILPENIELNDIQYPIKINKHRSKINIKGEELTCETDTFDTFMESSWYYLRYTSPNFHKSIVDPKSASYWLPVDFYVGGVEHAVMHLLYFRFYHKLLRDFNLVTTDEPVKKLLCQGMVLSEAFYFVRNKNEKVWVSSKDTIVTRDKQGKIIHANYLKNGKKLKYAGMIKMSKSKKNGIEPYTIVKNYGADSLRLFIMFASSPDASLEWKEEGIKGSYRFLNKLWKLYYSYFQKKKINVKLNIKLLNKEHKLLRFHLHKTIIKVSDDIEHRYSFNTAISSIMKLVNKLYKVPLNNDQDFAVMHESLLAISKMLYPFTPHFSFVVLKNFKKYNKNITNQDLWPAPDINAIQQQSNTVIIQINGKTRHTLLFKKTDGKEEIISTLKQNKKISKFLKDKTILKVFYIQGKLINLIVK